ncbi:MAG: DUF6036 family nucleotidyltransferase [Elusimicrobia bacterium]|nr:DUF6036 family nucleotidyltransferase [Elusimicrobiota bacterium]
MYTKTQLMKALNLLAQKLDLARIEPLGIFICGGSAMIIENYIERATKDIDVLAIETKNAKEKIIKSADPLPPDFLKIAKETARDLGLPETWINSCPASLKPKDFPEGCINRAHKHILSKTLTAYFLDRTDLIYLKVYAAADTGHGKHTNDLLSLKPTNEEIEKAAEWTLRQDISEHFKFILKDMLKKLGYEQVSGRI